MKKLTYFELRLIILLSFIFLCGCNGPGKGSISLINKTDLIEIHNGVIKAKFLKKDGQIFQQYFARKNNTWHCIVESFNSPSLFPSEEVQVYNMNMDPDHRFLVADLLERGVAPLPA
jgi:hypothetical protein